MQILAVHVLINHVEHERNHQPNSKYWLFFKQKMNKANWVDTMNPNDKKTW